jgi:hypothetical protein
VYKSRDVCCSPGVAFPDGCKERPKECWVVEDSNARTCRRDDRKCLQGARPPPPSRCRCGACACAATAGAPQQMCGFAAAAEAPPPLCRPLLLPAGYGVFASESACCAPGAAFQEGCAPVTPSEADCFVVDT